MLPHQLKAKKKKPHLKPSLWSEETDHLLRSKVECRAQLLAASSLGEARIGRKSNVKSHKKEHVVLSEGSGEQPSMAGDEGGLKGKAKVVSVYTPLYRKFH
jgi:hypothetical protein